MYDPAPQRGPMTPQERWISAIFLFVMLGLFAASIVHDYQPVKLSAFLFVLFWIPLLALHEASHAVVASFLGWYVGQVVIGMGRVVGQFRIGTASVELRLLPIEGFVRCVPTNLHQPQLKDALIYLAGPGSGLFLALVILVFMGSERMFTKSDDYRDIIWQSLALASVSQGVLNLIPHAVRKGDQEVANDGLGIIRSFTQPEAHYAAMIGHTYNEEKQDWESYDSADWWKRR